MIVNMIHPARRCMPQDVYPAIFVVQQTPRRSIVHSKVSNPEALANRPSRIKV